MKALIYLIILIPGIFSIIQGQVHYNINELSYSKPVPVSWNSIDRQQVIETNQNSGSNNQNCVEFSSTQSSPIVNIPKEQDNLLLFPITAGYQSTNGNWTGNLFEANGSMEILATLNYSGIFLQHTFDDFWVYNAQWSDFSHYLDSLAKVSNMRILDLDVYGKNNLYFAGTWIGDSKGWTYSLNYTISNDFSTKLSEWKNKNFRIIDLEIHPDYANLELSYSAIGVNDNASFAWIYHATSDQLQKWLTDQETENRRIIDIEAYKLPQSGELRFGAVAEANNPKKDWKAIANYEWNDFKTVLTTMKSEGYYLTDYEMYSIKNTKLYAGTWIKDDKSAGWTLNQHTSDNFIQQISTFAKSNKLYPIKFDIWDEAELSSVQSPMAKATADFHLAQNYPNPFNPETTIEFSLSQSELVQLIVLDVQGRQIMTLVNEFKPEGTHRIILNGQNLPSGIYFYTINAGKFKETKKLLLVR